MKKLLISILILTLTITLASADNAFKISSASNAHAGTLSGSSYNLYVLDEIIDGATNYVLWLSSTDNAHVSLEETSDYATGIDFGQRYQSCTTTKTYDECNVASWEPMIQLSGTTNAHVANPTPTLSGYILLCCQVIIPTCTAANAATTCDDTESCTDDTCVDSSCVNTPNDENSCSGGICSGGICAECTTATDCPPPDNDILNNWYCSDGDKYQDIYNAPTCVAGICNYPYTPSGVTCTYGCSGAAGFATCNDPPCSPDCTNKECGSDGCGGTCGPLSGACPAEESCKDGVCCESNDSYLCSGEDVYWYDSCGNKEEIKTDCGSTSTNDTYRCNGNNREELSLIRGCTGDSCTGPTESWGFDDNCADVADGYCDPGTATCKVGLLFWQDLSGNQITNTSLGKTVKMVYINGQDSTDLNFTIWENDDYGDGWNFLDEDVAEIIGTIQAPDMVGYWTIIEEDFLEEADDYENFRFSINGNDSQDLEIFPTGSDDPLTINLISPPCGFNMSANDTTPITFNVSDNDDLAEGTVSVNGIVVYTFPLNVSQTYSINHTFEEAGTSAIEIYAENSRGAKTKISSNIIVINTSRDGDYIASCILSPKNFDHIETGSVQFNASTTKALSYNATTAEISDIDFSLLRFLWTFSDGSTHPNSDGSNPISYRFTKTIRAFGQNSVTLNVIFK